MKPLFIFLIGLLSSFSLIGQIQFNNPSFEDEPSDATVPMGWFPCARSTTPDIGPGPWGIDLEAVEGETYLGLITRSDGSFESIGQRLSKRLQPGTCYKFSIFAAACDEYSGFNGRIQFRIWGNTRKCKNKELLYQSETIDYDEWKEHKIDFTPKSKIKYIIIEAFNPDTKSVKGHILLDHLSDIIPCNKV